VTSPCSEHRRLQESAVCATSPPNGTVTTTGSCCAANGPLTKPAAARQPRHAET
jgi:hypothetical protein